MFEMTKMCKGYKIYKNLYFFIFNRMLLILFLVDLSFVPFF